MRIVRITATDVIVRAHQGAIESPGLNKPLHRIPVHGSKSWTLQFDELPKVVLELALADGTTGLADRPRLDADGGIRPGLRVLVVYRIADVREGVRSTR